MNDFEVDVLILGGGLTGLTIGYELSKAGLTFKIVEKSSRFGGVIQTIKENGFMYETGPNTGIIGSPELGVLLDELKNDVSLQIGDEAVKRRLILKKGKWKAMPSGLGSAVTTPLYSLKDKFRILAEPFKRPGTNPDETLDKLVLRRMGKSFLDYAIDPFILGVYAGDPSLLVTKYAFPKLYNLEQNYGSFIGGTIKKRKEVKSDAEKLATRDVFSLKNGLEELVDVLAEKMGKSNILTDVDNLKVTKDGETFLTEASQKNDPIKLRSKRVISALNSTNLDAEMLPFIPPSFFDAIGKVNYAPTVEIVLGFNNWTGIELKAFGGLIPHREGREILGVLFLSAFLPNRAPEGGALLTIFMGGVRNSKWIDATEAEITSTIEKEMKELMELESFKPDLFKIIRHHKAIPQYSFESEAKNREIELLEKEHPGFLLGGNAVDGIGIADRVKQGVQLAAKVKNQLDNE